MIEVAIIGINHYDPLGREKVCRILCNDLIDFAPDSVAVEWKQEIADKVFHQREELKKELSQQYPFIETKDIELLSNAMAFEADAHIGIYPHLPIIWLDEERNEKANDENVINFYIYRKEKYDSIIHRGINNITDISNFICNNSSLSMPNERDLMFYNKLKKEIDKNGYSRIICIVGASHANNKKISRF